MDKQQRINELELEVQRLTFENQKLKRQSTKKKKAEKGVFIVKKYSPDKNLLSSERNEKMQAVLEIIKNSDEK